MLKNNTVNSNNVHTMNIFPTNLINYSWENTEELNKELTDAIHEMEKTTTSRQQSNVGGYHSEWNLFTWDYSCIKTLHNMIVSLAGYMGNASGIKEGETMNLSISGWSNIVRNGNYHLPHNHPNNTWSGVYYISGGNPDENIQYNGLFEFCDPRPAADMVTSDKIEPLRYQVKPKPGLMIMFPSFVNHFVHPFIGSGERITIAFNIRVI